MALRFVEHAPLQARNTFRVAAFAPLFVEITDRDDLAELLAHDAIRHGPLLVLGEGSNVLFAGDPPGLVASLALTGLSVLDDDGDEVIVRADAGLDWNALVHWTLAHGFEGLENLALIPGKVGAAPIQNIGAYGSEVGEHIAAVEAFDRSAGDLRRLDRDDCAFAYRDSVFKRGGDRWIVTAVEFRLSRRHDLRLDYAGIRDELAAMGVAAPRAIDVAAAVTRLRQRKLPDPSVVGNAGSFFKNPQVPTATAEALRADHPAIPVFPSSNPALCKLSAAWLIDACGWKGHREGDAGVSAQHALVLVNHGHATGAQLLDLANQVVDSVHAHFGIALEPEPRIVGMV